MPRLPFLILAGACLVARSASAQTVPDPPPSPKVEPAAAGEPAPVPVPEPTWQIRLDRPAMVGQRYTLSATGSQDRHTKATSPTQAPEVTAEHLEITYAAIHEIKAINKAGHPTAVLIRIIRRGSRSLLSFRLCPQ